MEVQALVDVLQILLALLETPVFSLLTSSRSVLVPLGLLVSPS